jgi:hypothetical protein
LQTVSVFHKDNKLLPANFLLIPMLQRNKEEW